MLNKQENDQGNLETRNVDVHKDGHVLRTECNLRATLGIKWTVVTRPSNFRLSAASSVV